MTGFDIGIPKKFSTLPKNITEEELVASIRERVDKGKQGKLIMCYILCYNSDRVFYKEECAEQVRQIAPSYSNKKYTSWDRIVGAVLHAKKLKNNMCKFFKIVSQRGMGKERVNCLQWIGPAALSPEILESIRLDTNEYRKKKEAGELDD